MRLPEPWRRRLMRGARWGFWLFFAKGLLWLLVPALMVLWASDAHAETTMLAVQTLDAASAERQAEAQSAAAERSIELRQVVVTGTRTAHALSDSPVDVQLITRQQIADSGARDVQQLLEREGGLTVSRVAGRAVPQSAAR
jgi:outer membrane receptor protein involved in Fe transport